ncbi:MOR1A protein, partial [Tichodroma muraria]|nr:MOR1A protein [Tichodroma muraria]
VGNRSVLTCPLKGQIRMLTWTITPKAGGSCTLVYRINTNMTHRKKCSDNLNWTVRAGLLSALEIRQVGIAQEGNYCCEVASTEGNFHTTYHLTVLEEKCHEDGTVTVLRKFTACSTNATNVTTCMVSHPAGNWSGSIAY